MIPKKFFRIIKNRNVFITSLTLLIMVTFIFCWNPILAIYLRKLGATDFQIGTSYTILVLAFSLLQFVGGYLSDKFGRKNLIALPTFVFPFLYTAAAFAPNWWILIIILTIINCFSAVQIPSFVSIVAESVDEEDRGSAFGILEISITAGISLGPLLGAMALPYVSFSALFLFTAFAALVCAFLRQFLLKETFIHEKHAGWKEVKQFFTRDLKWCTASFIFFTIMIILTVEGPFIALYGNDIIKLSERLILLMFALGGIAAVALSPLGGRIIEKIGSRRIMIIACLLHALFFIPWLYSKNLLWAVPFFMIAQIFFQLTLISHDTILSELTEIRVRSSIIGIIGTITGVIGAIAPMLGWLSIKFWGEGAPFFLAVLFAALTAAFLLPVKAR